MLSEPKFRNYVRSVAQQVIAERRKREDWREIKDLLTLLMRSQDEEDGEGLSDNQIAIELEVFLSAGHETTAHCMFSHMFTWSFLTNQHISYGLGSVSSCQTFRHFASFATRNRQRNGKPKKSNPWRHQAIQPTWNGDKGNSSPNSRCTNWLRYGEICKRNVVTYLTWESARQCVEDLELCGQHIPKGTTAWVPFYPIFVDPDLWEEPLQFKPERFAKYSASDPKFIPFSTGPRNCTYDNSCILVSESFWIHLLWCRYWHDDGHAGDGNCSFLHRASLWLPASWTLQRGGRPGDHTEAEVILSHFTQS